MNEPSSDQATRSQEAPMNNPDTQQDEKIAFEEALYAAEIDWETGYAQSIWNACKRYQTERLVKVIEGKRKPADLLKGDIFYNAAIRDILRAIQLDTEGDSEHSYTL